MDKGRRVLAALLIAGPSAYVVVVDDADFVSRRRPHTRNEDRKGIRATGFGIGCFRAAASFSSMRRNA